MATKKKRTFFEVLKKIPPKNMATKFDGGGGGGGVKALVAGPLKQDFFLWLPQIIVDIPNMNY